MEQELKSYKKHIKALLLCDADLSKSFMDDLENSIEDFISENHITDFRAVEKQFGTPEQIARGFFETANIQKIHKRLQLKQGILIGVLVLCFIWAIGVSFAAYDAKNANHGNQGWKEQIYIAISNLDEMVCQYHVK